MCVVVEIDQFSYMLLTKRKQKPVILQAWTTKQNGLNKIWPTVFAKCEITHNVLLWIHRVSTIVASVSKTWMLFQIQNFFIPRSRHDHFPRLSRFETRHWHSETETLKNVARDVPRDIQLWLQYFSFLTFLNYHRNRLFLYFLVNYQISIISLLLWVSIPNLAGNLSNK